MILAFSTLIIFLTLYGLYGVASYLDRKDQEKKAQAEEYKINRRLMRYINNLPPS